MATADPEAVVDAVTAALSHADQARGTDSAATENALVFGCSSLSGRWRRGMPLLETKVIGVEEIYVPVKRRKDLKPETVEAIAESMLEHGQKTPISVRSDGERFVLVEGLHRLEACKALGEATINAIVVAARQH